MDAPAPVVQGNVVGKAFMQAGQAMYNHKKTTAAGLAVASLVTLAALTVLGGAIATQFFGQNLDFIPYSELLNNVEVLYGSAAVAGAGIIAITFASTVFHLAKKDAKAKEAAEAAEAARVAAEEAARAAEAAEAARAQLPMLNGQLITAKAFLNAYVAVQLSNSVVPLNSNADALQLDNIGESFKRIQTILNAVAILPDETVIGTSTLGEVRSIFADFSNADGTMTQEDSIALFRTLAQRIEAILTEPAAE